MFNTNNNNNSNFRIQPDKYVDLAITNVLELPSKLIEKEENFNLDKYVVFHKILMNLLENIAIATGKIKVNKTEYCIDDLNETELELREKLIEYYKKTDVEIGQGAIFKADMVMRFILQGEYISQTSKIEEILNQKIINKEINKDIADAQLNNFKLQLIIKNISRSKIKKVDVGI